MIARFAALVASPSRAVGEGDTPLSAIDGCGAVATFSSTPFFKTFSATALTASLSRQHHRLRRIVSDRRCPALSRAMRFAGTFRSMISSAATLFVRARHTPLPQRRLTAAFGVVAQRLHAFRDRHRPNSPAERNKLSAAEPGAHQRYGGVLLPMQYAEDVDGRNKSGHDEWRGW